MPVAGMVIGRNMSNDYQSVIDDLNIACDDEGAWIIGGPVGYTVSEFGDSFVPARPPPATRTARRNMPQS